MAADRPGRGLLAGAAGLAPVAAVHAAEADADRALSPEVAKSLVTAGFARHFVPSRWGGDAGSTQDLLSAVTLVAAGCASAGWCGSLAAGAARMGAYLPEPGQRELWAGGADTLVAGALVPTGRAEQAPGGWRLSGEWPVTTGAAAADWALVCAPVLDGTREPWFFAVSRQQYEVRDTWNPAGLRGTASNTLVLEHAPVPAHRSFRREDMWHGRSVGSPAACHLAPLRLVSGVLFAAPALGATRGALAATAELLADRVAAGDLPVRLALARSAAESDAAELLLRRAGALADRGGATSVELARTPADCAVAVDLLVGAVERLARAAGLRGQHADSPVQRFWRDVHCLAGHVALRFDTAGAAYGALFPFPRPSADAPTGMTTARSG